MTKRVVTNVEAEIQISPDGRSCYIFIESEAPVFLDDKIAPQLILDSTLDLIEFNYVATMTEVSATKEGDLN